MSIRYILLTAFLAPLFSTASRAATTNIVDAEKQLDYCVRQVERSLKALKKAGTVDYDQSPKDILSGQTNWNLQPNCPEAWTWGFWPGILWMDYAYTHDSRVRAEAEKYSRRLAYLAERPAYDHDLGFLVFLGHEKAYAHTHSDEYRQQIVGTANELAKLFNPRIGTILSWPREASGKGRYQPYNTIIDNLINLEMLFWAANHGGDQRLKEIAVSHADVTMKNHFRKDYTCYHVAVYDTLTGDFIKGCTNQGYADSSTWSRGQAWAVYGYTMCYRMTNDARYLDFAQKVTDAFLQRLPEDYVPYWDFNDPAIPNAPRDASAAAAVASALLELCTYTPRDNSIRYYEAAQKILRSLSSKRYQSRNQNTAFLLHSTGNYPIGSQIDCSIVYADYYYMEALLRLKALNEQHFDPYARRQ